MQPKNRLWKQQQGGLCGPICKRVLCEAKHLKGLSLFEHHFSFSVRAAVITELTLSLIHISTSQFVFSHWEVLAVEYDNEATKTGKVSDEAFIPEGKTDPITYQTSAQVELTSAYDSEMSGAFLWQDAEALGLTAVSYTHLDVYKRQR